jgi:uncharacterized protein YraI
VRVSCRFDGCLEAVVVFWGPLEGSSLWLASQSVGTSFGAGAIDVDDFVKSKCGGGAPRIVVRADSALDEYGEASETRTRRRKATFV